MGCSESKLDPAHEITMPPKLMPVLRKRFQELTWRRRKGCSLKDQSTLSKKELLDSDNVSDEDDVNDQKNVSSQDEDSWLMKVAPAPRGSEATTSKEIKTLKGVDIKPVLLVCPTFATMLPVYEESCKDIEEDVHVEIVSVPPVVVAEVESIPTTPVGVNKKDGAVRQVEIASAPPPVVVAEVEDDTLNKRSGKENEECEEVEEQEKKVVVVQASESNTGDVEVSEIKGESKEAEDTDNEDEDEDEDEDIDDCADERLLCPGSPSFRMYCIQSESAKENDFEDKDEGNEETKGGDGNIESSEHSTGEGSVAKMKKKVKRGGRFRKVKLITKAKPMKNLLKVHSCYNPACGGNLEKVRLLSSKSHAA